jgi:hypothetical protein
MIAAAGDMACAPDDSDFNGGLGQNDRCRQMAVSDAIRADPGITHVIELGDMQYEAGEADAIAASYDPSWGRFKDITYPVAGNHEFYGEDANGDNTLGQGFYDYWSTGSGYGGGTNVGDGYYSFDVDNWHIVMLNSVCDGQLDIVFVGQAAPDCSPTGPQAEWLRADLAANADAECLAAAWHHPRYASHFARSAHGDGEREENEFWWNVLYEAGADIVLNGHEHNYERFGPQDPLENADPEHGIREFVVGTGGKGADGGFTSPLPNSEVQVNDSHGFLKLTLHAGAYDWEFVPASWPAGQSGYREYGSADCHSRPFPPTGAPFAEDFETGLGPFNPSGDPCWAALEPEEDPAPFHPTTNQIARAENCDDGGMITSPPINLAGQGSAELTFDRWVDDGLDGGEYLRVEIFDGASWVQVAMWTDGQGDDSTWHEEIIDLTPYLNESLQIRFEGRMNRVFEEVEIDDIAITTGT